MSINNYSTREFIKHRELWWGDITPYDFSTLRPQVPFSVPVPEAAPSKVLQYDDKNLALYAACGTALANWSALDTEIQRLRQDLSPEDASWETHKKTIQDLIAQRERRIQTVSDLMAQMVDRMSTENRKKYYKELTSFGLNYWDNKPAREVREKQKQLGSAALEMQSLAQTALQNIQEQEQIWLQEFDTGDFLHTVAQYRSRSNEENRAALEALYANDDDAYRYQSYACVQSFMQNERWQEASEFAASWMQSIHQDAPWSDVQKMAIALLLSQKDNSIGRAATAQFLQAFQNWLAQRPELSLDAARPVVAPEAGQPLTEAMQAELLLSRLHVLAQDTTLNAYTHYTNALILQPDDPTHRLGLAFIDMATGKWQEAQGHIDLLPEEWRAAATARLVDAHYSVVDLMIEIANRAFSGLVIPFIQNTVSFGSKGRLAVHTFNGALQVAAHPAIKIPLIARSMANGDLLLQQSISPITKCSFTLLLSTVVSPLVVPPIIVELIPDPVKRTAYIGRIENVALPAIRSVGHLSLAIFSGGNVIKACAYSLPDIAFSLTHAAIYLSGKQLPITGQASLTATNRLLSKASAAMTGYVYRGAISILAKNTLARVASQRVCLAVGQTLGRLSITNAMPVISIAAVSIGLAHAIFWDFPKTRTALLLTQVSSLCAHRQPDMADNLLQSAANWMPLMSDQKVIAAYRACVPFLQKIPALTRSVKDQQFVCNDFACSQTLATLNSSSYYADAATDLQYRQIIASIQTGQIQRARQIILALPKRSPILSQLVNFAIDAAAMYDQRQDARDYLQSLIPCFAENSPLRKIFNEYCIYLDRQIAFPEISYEVDNNGNLLRYQSIERLLELTDTSELASTQKMLYFEAVQIALVTADQQRARKFLKHLDSYAQARSAEAIIEQTQELCRGGNSIGAVRSLRNASTIAQYVHAPMLAKYLALTRHEVEHQTLSSQTPAAVVDARLQAIDAVVDASRKEIDIRPELYRKKLFVLVHTDRYEEAAVLLTQHAFSEADRHEIMAKAASHCIQCFIQREYVQTNQLLQWFQNMPDVRRAIFDRLAYVCVANINNCTVLQSIREALPSLFDHALMRQHFHICTKFSDLAYNPVLRESMLQELSVLEEMILQLRFPIPKSIYVLQFDLHYSIGTDALARHSWRNAREHLSGAKKLLLNGRCGLQREYAIQILQLQLSQIPPEHGC